VSLTEKGERRSGKWEQLLARKISSVRQYIVYQNSKGNRKPNGPGILLMGWATKCGFLDHIVTAFDTIFFLWIYLKGMLSSTVCISLFEDMYQLGKRQ
jgi:hypothetical protein